MQVAQREKGTWLLKFKIKRQRSEKKTLKVLTGTANII